MDNIEQICCWMNNTIKWNVCLQGFSFIRKFLTKQKNIFQFQILKYHNECRIRVTCLGKNECIRFFPFLLAIEIPSIAYKLWKSKRINQRLPKRLCKYFPLRNPLDLSIDFTSSEEKQRNNFVSRTFEITFQQSR